MNAEEFNKRYPVGATFLQVANKAEHGGRVVSTVARANDFKCGCIVEINREPYFVKIKNLRKAD